MVEIPLWSKETCCVSVQSSGANCIDSGESNDTGCVVPYGLKLMSQESAGLDELCSTVAPGGLKRMCCAASWDPRATCPVDASGLSDAFNTGSAVEVGGCSMIPSDSTVFDRVKGCRINARQVPVGCIFIFSR